jgi:hypothetical protein
MNRESIANWKFGKFNQFPQEFFLDLLLFRKG